MGLPRPSRGEAPEALPEMTISQESPERKPRQNVRGMVVKVGHARHGDEHGEAQRQARGDEPRRVARQLRAEDAQLSGQPEGQIAEAGGGDRGVARRPRLSRLERAHGVGCADRDAAVVELRGRVGPAPRRFF